MLPMQGGYALILRRTALDFCSEQLESSTREVKHLARVAGAGVYVFSVLNKTNRPGKFDEKTEEQKLRQKAMQMAGNFMNELYIKAHVVDNRYLFF